MNRYAWNRSLIEPFTRMSLWGIAYDSPAAAAMRHSLEAPLWTKQAAVDGLAGVQLPTSVSGLLALAADRYCHKVRLRKQLKGYKERRLCADIATGGPMLDKKGKVRRETYVVPPRLLTWALAAEVANMGQVETLGQLRELSERQQSPARDAQIASLLGLSCNVESPDQVIALLDRLGLPAKYKRGKHDPNDPEAGRTGDEEALLDLFVRTGHPVTKAILEARAVRGAASFLDAMKVDKDGRVRCSFANPGSETGRVLTRTWHSGSGGNLQAVSAAPYNFRKLLVADEGMLVAQCDLKAADAWTVAARCAQCGDPTMLRDMQAGVRIPSFIALVLAGARIPSDHAELAALCKTVTKDWRDYAYKKATYLSFYMGSSALIRRETVRESWAETGTPIDPGLEFCKQAQDIVLRRYWGLRQWWAECERQVRRNGTLEGASGQVREFMSRRWSGEGAAKRLDHSCHKEVVATEPQMTTTYATNLALWRLWSDPQNWIDGRAGTGTPYVQPLLHIHDAILVQFPSQHVAAAGRKLAEWFNNPLRIGNVTVKIPVESRHGPSWGETDNAFPP